jgi:hypothetical protein
MRIGLADGERKYDDLEKRLAALRVVDLGPARMRSLV